MFFAPKEERDVSSAKYTNSAVIKILVNDDIDKRPDIGRLKRFE